jgi:DNA modification methylase
MSRLYYEDEHGQFYLGDAREVLESLPEGSVDLCVTSPPYWQVRNYGVEGQLGQEPYFNDYIDRLCNILDFVKVPLKGKGNLFVNIGDTYFSKSKGTGGRTKKQLTNKGSYFQVNKLPSSMPDGALVNIPGRFSIQMVDEWGWTLKHTIIWHKPNAFVTSNKKKFTLDFEYVYHFILDTKGYYFEQQFEPLKNPIAKSKNATNKHEGYGNATYSGFEYDATKLEKGRNKRSVWSINTRGFKGSHFATYPTELIEVPIKACCPERICNNCGKPSMPILEREMPPDEIRNREGGKMNYHPTSVGSGQKLQNWYNEHPLELVGYTNCGCDAGFHGGVVLDPFIDSGTTAIEAERQGKKWIGIDINKEYINIAIERILGERNGRH